MGINFAADAAPWTARGVHGRASCSIVALTLSTGALIAYGALEEFVERMPGEDQHA